MIHTYRPCGFDLQAIPVQDEKTNQKHREIENENHDQEGTSTSTHSYEYEYKDDGYHNNVMFYQKHNIIIIILLH